MSAIKLAKPSGPPRSGRTYDERLEEATAISPPTLTAPHPADTNCEHDETTVVATPNRSPSRRARTSTKRSASMSIAAPISHPPQTEALDAAQRTPKPIRRAPRHDPEEPSGQASDATPPNASSPAPDDLLQLRTLAEMFADAQKHRLAQENRLRSGAVEKLRAEELSALAKRFESRLTTPMQNVFKRCYPVLAQWIGDQPGLGLHSVARLVGIIGDIHVASPYIPVIGKAPEGHICGPTCGKVRGNGHEKHLVALPQYQRMLSQLWSYCGVGDATRKRSKDMTAEDARKAGSPAARAVLYTMTGPAIQSNPRYRAVYDAARLKYHDREGWTKMHQHNAALRLVAKEILRDMYRVTATIQGAVPTLGPSPSPGLP